jgi:isopenicillin N synthase-like dioxygenase
MSTLEELCRKLVPLYALALDLPRDHLDAFFAKPHMVLRQSRYPLIDADDDSVANILPHTDAGFMTLLPPNKVEGLSIQLPNGEWMDAPHVEGAFVVNGGDILHRWTNERFLSTPHRVRNISGTLRFAIPFFFDPEHDTVIECLPTCQSMEKPAKYPPDQARRLRRLVCRAALQPYGQGRDQVGGRDRTWGRHLPLEELTPRLD